MRRLRPLLVSVLLSLPVGAWALEQRTITMTTGIRISFSTAVQNLIGFLAASIVSIATVLFLVGAGYMVASAGKPERVETGKKLMKGSLIGMAIVLCSYTILRTVLYLIY